MNTTTITAHDLTDTETETRRTGFVRAGLIAGVAAAAINTGVVAIADNANVSLVVQRGGDPIPVLGFTQITFVCALIGIALAAILRRRSDRPAALFTRITIALTAASLIPPVLVHAEASTKLLLIATHVVAAAMIIPVIAKRLAR